MVQPASPPYVGKLSRKFIEHTSVRPPPPLQPGTLAYCSGAVALAMAWWTVMSGCFWLNCALVVLCVHACECVLEGQRQPLVSSAGTLSTSYETSLLGLQLTGWPRALAISSFCLSSTGLQVCATKPTIFMWVPVIKLGSLYLQRRCVSSQATPPASLDPN